MWLLFTSIVTNYTIYLVVSWTKHCFNSIFIWLLLFISKSVATTKHQFNKGVNLNHQMSTMSVLNFSEGPAAYLKLLIWPVTPSVRLWNLAFVFCFQTERINLAFSTSSSDSAVEMCLFNSATIDSSVQWWTGQFSLWWARTAALPPCLGHAADMFWLHHRTAKQMSCLISRVLWNSRCDLEALLPPGHTEPTIQFGNA